MEREITYFYTESEIPIRSKVPPKDLSIVERMEVKELLTLDEAKKKYPLYFN